MSRYKYQRPVRRSNLSKLRIYISAMVILASIIALISGIIISGLRTKNNPPISGVSTTEVSDNKETFINSVFQFSDYGKWVLNKRISTSSHYVYEKYLGQELQGVLNVYVNTPPAEPNVTATRVLPVRLVNDNSFQVTGVSDPCSNQFAPNEIHRVKEFVINGATMLCDPSSGIYTVVISQIGGDYNIGLKNSHGQSVQFTIIYRNDMASPEPDTITNVANSFKVL